jgi:hypothetical protein
MKLLQQLLLLFSMHPGDKDLPVADTSITGYHFEWNFPEMKYDSTKKNLTIKGYTKNYTNHLKHKNVIILVNTYQQYNSFVSNYERTKEDPKDTSFFVETFFLYKPSDKKGLFIDNNKRTKTWLTIDSFKTSLFAFQTDLRQGSHEDKNLTLLSNSRLDAKRIIEEYRYYSRSDTTLKGTIQLVLENKTPEEIPFTVINNKEYTVLEATYYSNGRIMQPNNVKVDPAYIYYKITPIKESISKYRKVLSDYELGSYKE